MEVDFEAIETLIGSRECWTDLSDPMEVTPIGSASKGKVRAEIEGREEGDFFCLLVLLKVRQRQSVGGFPFAFVEVILEF